MVNDVHIHEHINGVLLDRYLALGWYRMGQVIFTTNEITHNDELLSVNWLRYNINNVILNKKHLALLKQNQIFNVSIKPFKHNTEVDELYEQYLKETNFDASPTLGMYLYSGEEQLNFKNNVFESYCIEVRNQGTLIGLGIFDNGQSSIAGIINFYDPAFKKYSLGKYIMLLKVITASQNKKKFYYPGYVVNGWPKFNYKLFIGESFAESFNIESLIWEAYKKG